MCDEERARELGVCVCACVIGSMSEAMMDEMVARESGISGAVRMARPERLCEADDG